MRMTTCTYDSRLILLSTLFVLLASTLETCPMQPLLGFKSLEEHINCDLIHVKRGTEGMYLTAHTSTSER